MLSSLEVEESWVDGGGVRYGIGENGGSTGPRWPGHPDTADGSGREDAGK